MFCVALLKDTVRLAPEQFHLNLVDAIRDEINRKLANKVLLNVGLCIGLKDITELGDSTLVPGDGSSHTEVKFRYIVFRPTVGNVITGKIRSCSREGVHVTLGFFDDVLIPPEALQHPSRFEETEQAWVWEYPVSETEKHDLFMDIGEPIKFRISREIFVENSPIGPPKLDMQSQPIPDVGLPPQKDHNTPYKLVAAINESGLGVLSWWDQPKSSYNEGEGHAEPNAEEYDNDEDGEGAYEE